MQLNLLPAVALFLLLSPTAQAQVVWTRTSQMAASTRDLLRFDPARQRLVVFDRADLADAWEWSGGPWVHRTSVHTPPVPGPGLGYVGVQVAVDTVRNRLVAGVPVVGTASWSLWEWDGTDWLQPAAVQPPGGLHFMVFDPATRRVLVVTTFQSTWSWDGTTWRSHAGVGPGASEILEVAADPLRNRVVALGIDASSALPSSTWEWNGQAWTRLSGVPLPPLGGPLAFEPLRGRVVACTDWGTWDWDGQRWQSWFMPLPPHFPGGVYTHDVGRSQLVYFGGRDPGAGLHADFSAWNGTSWMSIAVGGVVPSLSGTRAALAPGRGRVVVTGGQTLDTWEWDVRAAQWTTRLQSPVLGQRLDPAVAYDERRGNVVRFGGRGNSLQGLLDEFSEWTPSAVWVPVPATQRPTRRTAAAMAYDAARGQLVLFGGLGADTVGQPIDLGDTWVFDGSTWRDMRPANAPDPRVPFGMTYDVARARVVLVGGRRTQGAGEILDTWEWDGSAWLQRVSGVWNAARSFYPPLLQYDVARQRTVRIGGPNWSVDEWDGTQWLPRAATAPPATAPNLWDESPGAHLVYATTERTMLLFSAQSREVWRYGPTRPANFALFGSACAATGQPAPRLQASGGSLPWSGATFATEVQGLRAAQPVLMLLGSSRTSWLGVPLPIDLSPLGMPGCMLRVSANLIDTATISGGVARWNLPIPGDPALLGGSFHLQALLADPTANAGGLLVTEGGTGTIGAR